MESGAISNGQVRASTEWDANHAAIQARLNFKAVRGKGGSWSAKHNNLGQWLQIDLGNKHTKVTGLATQGRNGFHQWVTKYKVQYSDDGVHFQYYTEQGQVGSEVKSLSTFTQPYYRSLKYHYVMSMAKAKLPVQNKRQVNNFTPLIKFLCFCTRPKCCFWYLSKPHNLLPIHS